MRNVSMKPCGKAEKHITRRCIGYGKSQEISFLFMLHICFFRLFMQKYPHYILLNNYMVYLSLLPYFLGELCKRNEFHTFFQLIPLEGMIENPTFNSMVIVSISNDKQLATMV